MKKNRILLATLITTAVSVGFATRGTSPQAEARTVQMWTATNGARHQVEFRWIPEEGWLSPEGYNLYRIQGAAATKVNDRPILPDQAEIAKDLPLKEMITTASQALSTPGQAQVKAVVSGYKTRTVRAREEFLAARREAQIAIAAPSGQVAGRIRTQIASNPKVKQMLEKRLAPARKAAGVLKSTNATPAVSRDENILDARDSLRMASLVSAKTAQQLGMSYSDDKVVVGQSYYYELRAITKGQESLAVRTRVTVGQDTPAIKPIVEDPIQLSQTEVGLHFSALSDSDSVEHGLIQYNVYRVVDGVRTLVNGDKPIVQSYAPTTDGKLQEHLLTFADAKAPARKSFSYEVEATDIFGRKASTSVACTMADLAEPLEQPVPICVGPLEKGLPSVKNQKDLAVGIYWVPARHTTEDTPTSIANEGRGEGRKTWEKIVYVVLRRDAEASSSNPVVVSDQLTAAGTPVTDFSELTVGAMLKLYPGIASQLNPLMKTKTNPGGMTEDSPASLLFNQRKYPSLPNWRLDVVKLVDTKTNPDHYYTYQLTAVLSRNGRNGIHQNSGKVGVPALIVPGSPSEVQQSNVLAPSTPAEYQSLKARGAMTNASSRQLDQGRLSAQGALLKPVTAGVGRGAAQVTSGKSSATQATKKKPVVVGVQTNYGRVVSLNWQAPQYITPVFYRVYRAVATGYRTPSGESTSVGLRRATAGTSKLKSEAQVQTGGASKVAKVATQRPLLQRGVALAGTAKFMGEFTPGADEYSLLGATKDAETAFTDLVPRSQSMSYYYVVEPVNRWGQAGSRSAPMKAALDPSLNPSVPIIESVAAENDGSVKLMVAMNLAEEKVTKYEVYRMEVPMPVVPKSKTDPTKPVRPTFAGAAAIKVNKLTTAPAKTIAQGSSAKGRFGVGAKPEKSVQTKELQGNLFAVKAPGTAGAKLVANPQMNLANYTLLTTLTPSAATGAGLPFDDTTVQGGKAYVYRVVAINVADLKSDPTLPYDGIPIKVVADPPTVDLGTAPFDEITYTITFKVNRPASGANAYLIERSSDAGVTWKDLGARECVGPVTIVDDKPVRGGQTYLYRVSSVDFAGNVSTPVEVTVVTGV